jgi:hypothetical protein
MKMPGWRFQWPVALAATILGAVFGLPLPSKRGPPLHIVATDVLWQNILVMAAIGFLIGSSVGGFVTQGWYGEDTKVRPVTSRFSLRVLFFVLAWFSVLLCVIAFIANHSG